MLENSRHTPSCKRSEKFLALVFAKKPHILPPYHRQEKGIAPTHQIVEQLCDPPTAEEIFDKAAPECPGLPKGSDNKSFLSVQLLQIVYQTDILLRLCQQTGKFLSGNTVYRKRSLLPDKRINNCQITYFFVNHLFFITLLTTRTEDTSLFVEVKTSTFHT